jgi:hypothetical protein
MRTVGFIATGIAALVVLLALITFLVSIPDMARYLRVRKM